MFDGIELNETQRTLLEAKESISDPKRWCRDTTRDHLGRRCAGGAVMATKNVDWRGFEALDEYNFLKTAAHEFGYVGIPNLNDKADHPTVMAMFTRAIELAGEGQ